MNIKIIKNIEIKCSLEWLNKSFHTFREQPLQFVCLGIVSTILSFIPIMGAFFMPIFVARFALITNTIESKQTFKFSALFKEMFTNKEILKLAIINFCISTIFYLVNYVNEEYIFKSNEQLFDNLVILIMLIPLILFQLSMWLSPILCLFNKISAIDAMILSFKASMFNFLLLFCYAILVLLFFILALIPIGLGLIIWLPILNISTYYVYRSMFNNNYNL